MYDVTEIGIDIAKDEVSGHSLGRLVTCRRGPRQHASCSEDDQDWLSMEEDEEMPNNKATKFRRAVARPNY